MKKIYLAFLWHHHQPMYKNPSTGMYELPWTRLHATKDYFDTAAILDEFPSIKATFNLVPSLLTQLAEYAQGLASDRYQELSAKNADKLTPEEKEFILYNFFMANWETMIDPYPRYRQLLDKRGRHASPEELRRVQAYFTSGEMRDLQVWFNLSWMDPYWKGKDELVRTLYARGRDFTEGEKLDLLAKQKDICGRIVDKYRQLQDTGQIEVSTTPFYHPILPLLCDTNAGRESSPEIILPQHRFQHREDAREQVRKAVDYYQRCFGRPPRGMWPSEGSVSEEAVPLIAEAGIRWIASDEAVLFRTHPEISASREHLYKPYQLEIGESRLHMVFRDHGLSDAIGFVYSRWDPHTAAADFMKRIHAIRDMVSNDPGDHLISVILDGENCWEYYPNDGWDFLRLLYQALSDDPTVETVTISQYLSDHPSSSTLRRLCPGSWINANFNIWIGHPEDNLAWDYLHETRQFLNLYTQRHPELKDTPEVRAAWEKIYIAEGSDWNWWYGDDHSSGNDTVFDYLFRQNLISVYELLHEKAPDHLHKAIKGAAKRKPTLEPVDFITPRIDGRVSDYFEWQPAGFYDVGHSGGSMHQVETLLRSIYYGFDLENLYLRLDANSPLDQLPEKLSFHITFLKPEDLTAVIEFDAQRNLKNFYILKSGQRKTLHSFAYLKVLEAAIPLSSLGLSAQDTCIEFSVAVFKDDQETERWPYESTIVLPKPSPGFNLKNWSV